MRGKTAVYPVSSTASTKSLTKERGGGFYNGGLQVSPEEVQVTHPKHVIKTPIDDPWQLTSFEEDNTPKWRDLSTREKMFSSVKLFTKLSLAVTLLYLFVCSLDFLSNSFRLIAGRTAGSVFQNEYISNPVVGLMIGILVTVLVQSSSTSTSIIVSMVNSGILRVPEAIPMIMGSNIGTSVTNTIVSLTQVGDRNVFRRAFAGATVHDMFNWLSVIVLLSVEVATGMLEKLTSYMMDSADWSNAVGGKFKLLKVITEPFTKMVIQIDKKVLTKWSLNDPDYVNASLIKQFCKYEKLSNGAKVGIPRSCDFLFANTSMDDNVIGFILLLSSLVMLCVALILIVKILSSLMKGSIAQIIRITLNSDIPYVPWLTGYLAIMIGALMTVLVQSSSIFTSTITPLIGLGLISVERSYPLTLGSNIGTTTTALLASIAGEGIGIKSSIQIALVHLFFNIFGILIFYPVPFMRIPIPLSKALGNVTADYRWFAVMYLVMMFCLLPGLVFTLSLAGPVAMYSVGVPIIIFFVTVIIINIIQNKRPGILPTFLRTWDFVPLPLRSLEPYDKFLTAAPCCKSCRNDVTNGLQNPTTVIAIPTLNSKGDLEKVENGQVTLVEARTFFPVGPVSQNNGNVLGQMRKLSDGLDGISNRGLDIQE